MSDEEKYRSILSERYASEEMSKIFSPKEKYVAWRKLWLELARAEKELGATISDSQIAELQECVEKVDIPRAMQLEKETRHDVMAHILSYGEQAPHAKPIIHLGATSCFVTDNGDLIQFRKALALFKQKLVQLIRALSQFCERHKGTPTVGWTHFQPAQTVSLGKRAAMWLQDFLVDLNDLEHVEQTLSFLGVKGATGSQASFLELFDGDEEKVFELDRLVAKAFGFTKTFSISGQTYTRKQDARIMGVLRSFAASAHKFATDLRLLAHLGEIREERSSSQVGSSAMPHKQNPIRSERVCGIARYLISLCENGDYTHATQWLERSLDDSSSRRLFMPDAFLAADAVVDLLLHTVVTATVEGEVIEKNLAKYAPKLALEMILMKSVKAGGDRQENHDKLRKLAAETRGDALHETLVNRVDFPLSSSEIEECIESAKSIGMCRVQVDKFLEIELRPVLERYQDLPEYRSHIEV